MMNVFDFNQDGDSPNRSSTVIHKLESPTVVQGADWYSVTENLPDLSSLRLEEPVTGLWGRCSERCMDDTLAGSTIVARGPVDVSGVKKSLAGSSILERSLSADSVGQSEDRDQPAASGRRLNDLYRQVEQQLVPGGRQVMWIDPTRSLC